MADAPKLAQRNSLNLKCQILFSKKLNRDHPLRKDSMQMDLDDIPWRQNSERLENYWFQFCLSSFCSSSGEEILRISGFSNPYAFRNCSLTCVLYKKLKAMLRIQSNLTSIVSIKMEVLEVLMDSSFFKN